MDSRQLAVGQSRNEIVRINCMQDIPMEFSGHFEEFDFGRQDGV